MNEPCQDAATQCDTSARQAAVDKIDCHEALRRAAMSSLGDDWKEASIFRLRAFLMTHSIEE